VCRSLRPRLNGMIETWFRQRRLIDELPFLWSLRDLIFAPDESRLCTDSFS
jgi:hypothetical protein